MNTCNISHRMFVAALANDRRPSEKPKAETARGSDGSSQKRLDGLMSMHLKSLADNALMNWPRSVLQQRPVI